MAVEPQPSLSGIIEVDETYFVKSFKGHRGWKRGQRPAERPPRYRGSGALRRGLSNEQVPVLTAVDRSKNHFDMVLQKRGKKAVLESLAPHIESGSIICSDGYPAFRELADKSACEHHLIEFELPTPDEKAEGLPRGRRGALTLGRINNWHEVMDTRFNRIHRGVSTRYLPHYLTLLANQYAEKLQPKDALQRAMAAPAIRLPQISNT